MFRGREESLRSVVVSTSSDASGVARNPDAARLALSNDSRGVPLLPLAALVLPYAIDLRSLSDTALRLELRAWRWARSTAVLVIFSVALDFDMRERRWFSEGDRDEARKKRFDVGVSRIDTSDLPADGLQSSRALS